MLHEAGMRERGDEEAGCELAQVESGGKEVWSASRDVEVGGARFQVLKPDADGFHNARGPFVQYYT